MRNITEVLNKLSDLTVEHEKLKARTDFQAGEKGEQAIKERDSAMGYTKGKINTLRWILGDTTQL